MYNIAPPAVYIREHVLNDKVCVERMDRMMSNIDAKKVEIVTEQRLQDLNIKFGKFGVGEDYRGINPNLADPVVIFDRFEWPQNESTLASNELDLSPDQVHWATKRDTKRMRECEGIVCQNGFVIRFAEGCIHQCAYCPLTRAIRIFLNLEEYPEHLDALIKKHPWYTLYFSDGGTDLMCFEPEYGACEIMVNYFAQKKGKYLNLTTKSDNVDHLLNLEHKGKTIISWTISCETISRLIERGTPSLKRRLEAMRKCQKSGYVVRCRFSPIIPLKSWQEENSAMIEQVFRAVQPDVITLWVLAGTDFESFESWIDLGMIDKEYVEAAAKAADTMRGQRMAPFPPEIRVRIYRFFIEKIRRVSPRTPISLCLETSDMWERLAGDIGATPERYFCNCGAQCAPGTDLYREFIDF